MNKQESFDIIAQTLPFAINGYYVTKEKAWAELNENEKNGLKKILKPYIEQGYFQDDDLVKACFTCLFRAIKIWVRNSEIEHKQQKQYLEENFQSTEILDLIGMFKAKEFQMAEFFSVKGEKIRLNGIGATQLLEKLFYYFEEFEPDENTWYGRDANHFALSLIKDYYNRDLANKAKKRHYKKKVDFDEYHRRAVVAICKQLHKFLVNYSSLVPKGNKTSNDELRLIIDFLKLTKLKELDDLATLRRLIDR